MDHLDTTAITNTSNRPSNTTFDIAAEFPDSGHLVGALLLSLSVLLGIPGNIAVVVLLARNTMKLSSLSRSLMLNLAASDLLCLVSMIVWVPALLFTWTYGLVLCKVISYCNACSAHATLLNVTLLSVHRYLSVIQNQRWARLGQAMEKSLLVLIWASSLTTAIPFLVFRQLVEDGRSIDCVSVYSSEAQEVAWLTTECLLGFVVPFSIMASSYICLHKTVNQTVFFHSPRMTRVVTGVIVTFIICWMPYYIVNILVIIGILSENQFLVGLQRWKNITTPLLFLNCSLDPLLYAFAVPRCWRICRTV